MVFKMRALGFGGNISDFSPKPSLLVQQHVFNQRRGKKTPFTTGHFGTINSYMVILCWHYITFNLLSIGAKCLHHL